MTVQELIEKLKGFPADAEVIYRMHSEFDVLNVDDPALVRAEDEEIIYRNGRYMRCDKDWLAPGERAEWTTVVTLPGN